ncbi:glutamate/tyrosine decarboxylase-like PLP-dependent enzyme [Motilibacter peucedani]|uniref:Glutamate/tyrosine decarboxylase-like PLP-dependent enzyme n=1 Tax=Motilibacter peucedani TaxID=598650 RepID=A0A420XPU8_9ACTN|nr:aspartate aminotransferase family protein [Motilibacter peucedani]RKS75298.1 glutamate/tyrosine decarboxylase-like PLP-dependent enzyme [Motilibacter peucedani]
MTLQATRPAAVLPARGVPRDELLRTVFERRADDAPWREGRIFSLVYHPGSPELEELLAAVSREYLAENALNPRRFPSLARMEREAADIVAGLLHGTPGAGGLTSGGTESIFLAVYVAREVARGRGIASPRIVTGRTAHPAFAKACHLLGVRQERVPVRADRRVDVEALAAAVDEDTILVVASAPNYPYGVVDDVPAVAAVARDAGILCHVDACLGGLLLPFWERIGEPVAPWDFRVEGVTSISADIHKYGYSFKGASALLWRDPAHYRAQWWVDDDVWGGGLYGSSTTAGTRPAPPIAGAWAALHGLGEEGYLRLARSVRDARDRLLAGLAGIADLAPTVAPDLSVLEIGSSELDLGAVADALEERRWWLDRQPGGLHLMLSPYHREVVDDLLAALRAAVDDVRAGRVSRGVPAAYAAVP